MESPTFDKLAEQKAAIDAGFARLRAKYAAFGDSDAAQDGGRAMALQQLEQEAAAGLNGTGPSGLPPAQMQQLDPPPLLGGAQHWQQQQPPPPQQRQQQPLPPQPQAILLPGPEAYAPPAPAAFEHHQHRQQQQQQQQQPAMAGGAMVPPQPPLSPRSLPGARAPAAAAAWAGGPPLHGASPLGSRQTGRPAAGRFPLDSAPPPAAAAAELAAIGLFREGEQVEATPTSFPSILPYVLFHSPMSQRKLPTRKC